MKETQPIQHSVEAKGHTRVISPKFNLICNCCTVITDYQAVYAAISSFYFVLFSIRRRYFAFNIDFSHIIKKRMIGKVSIDELFKYIALLFRSF